MNKLRLLYSFPVSTAFLDFTHTARHTFGTYLINKGISLESVSQAMGHSNLKQTQHYARLLGKTVIKDMKEKLNE